MSEQELVLSVRHVTSGYQLLQLIEAFEAG